MHLLQILVTFVPYLSNADDNRLQKPHGASWKSDLQFLARKIDHGPFDQGAPEHHDMIITINEGPPLVSGGSDTFQQIISS